LRAIGGAAVVNRLARFCLDNCGAWVGAAAQPIAAKARSYKVNRVNSRQKRSHPIRSAFQVLRMGKA
jgi:hypothetical protein